MRFIRNLSLGSKFTFIAVLTTSVSLAIACGAFAFYEQSTFRKTMARDFMTITDIFDENVSGGLAFNDVESMEETLGTLAEDKRIVAAAVYDTSGARVATYRRQDVPETFEFPSGLVDGQRFTEDRIDTFRYVELAGDTIGVVYIGADLEELHERAWRTVFVTLLLLAACSLVALVLASRLQRLVSGPVVELAATADRIAVSRDFSLRATKVGEDEVGHLVDGFNNMLSQIQVRDMQLQEAREDLERRVEDRTAALVHEIRERSEAEAALARSHSVINATLESTVDGILVIDSAGHVKHFNRRFADIWGVAPETIATGRQAGMLDAAARRLRNPIAFIRYARAAYQNQAAEFSDILEFKDGRIVELYTRPQVSDGVSEGRVWSVRDITERKRIEAEITYERDLLQVLMDTVPDLLYFKDLESRFVRVSRSKLVETFDILRACHGKATTDVPYPQHLADVDSLRPWIIGKTDLDVFTEGDATQMKNEEKEIIATGQPVTGKVEHITLPSGAPLWYLVSKMPWRDRTGRIIGTYGISKNITQIKLAEEEVRRVHEQLLKASRQAGMAEVATGVLHNVGNVLNSVNVSAGVLRETLRASEVSTLSRVAGLLMEHADDIDTFLTQSPRGRLLPRVVVQLAEQLEREHATLASEQEHLSRNVEHIKSIVAMQQNFATVSGVLEKIRPTDLLRDVVQMHSAGIARLGIEVVRDYADIPSVIMDQHKVMQILVNLITNAKRAIKDANRRDGRIQIGMRLNGNGRIAISIADNGVGIPAENLTRIFSHGFTTRQDGHGFGLHSGALAAKELGGSLSVHSDGPGLGATFTLEIPAKSPAPLR